MLRPRTLFQRDGLAIQDVRCRHSAGRDSVLDPHDVFERALDVAATLLSTADSSRGALAARPGMSLPELGRVLA